MGIYSLGSCRLLLVVAKQWDWGVGGQYKVCATWKGNSLGAPATLCCAGFSKRYLGAMNNVSV